MPANKAFSCRRCGHCCEGEGGIVLSEDDVTRLCSHLQLEAAAFLAGYAVRRHGKIELAAKDGRCVFYTEGCGVHPARPDICRAWPFFKGNLLDAVSHNLAMDYCPGINPDVPHAEFASQGRAYLADRGLARPCRGQGAAEALCAIPADDSGDE